MRFIQKEKRQDNSTDLLNYFDAFGSELSSFVSISKKFRLRALLILVSSLVSMLSRAKMLYMFVRSQLMALASHVTVRPCCLSSSLMICPM